MEHFDASVDESRRLVRITATGQLEKQDGERIITTARRLAAEHGYDVIYDVRQARLDVPLAEWFLLPRELPVLSGAATRRVRAAVVIPRGDQEPDYRFYETVTANVGLAVRMFFDEEDALAWLAQQTRDG